MTIQWNSRVRCWSVFALIAAAAGCGESEAGPEAVDEEWVEAKIAEALTAAPAVVTHDARIFAWTDDGRRVLIREGTGPYTCIASGSYSLRLGSPALPHPDPLCADQNAWAFFEAIWSEEDPLNPSASLPMAPGLVWMLRGMNIASGEVSYGSGSEGRLRIGGDAGGVTDTIINMTPHVMIWPLPIDAQLAELPAVYDAISPPTQWVMAGGTTVAHLHVHFSDATAEALEAIRMP